MPERPDTSAKLVNLAAYRAYRQALARRQAGNMPETIMCRCILAYIPGLTEGERDA